MASILTPDLSKITPAKLKEAAIAMAILAKRGKPFEIPETLQAPKIIPDVAKWIGESVTIEEPQGDTVSIIPFHLWAAQEEALSLVKKSKQVIILKARQLGLSWLLISYSVWLCIYHPSKSVLVFSKDQDSANEMIRRAKGIFNRLKEKPTEIKNDPVTSITWGNESRIKAFAATEDAGSSFTGSMVILDEFAKMRYASELYTAVKPTIDDGGKICIISTAKGENIFHTLWAAATKKENGFSSLFIPWSARPERTAEWYARVESDSVSSAHHRQEYPATPEEAFTVVGEERFLPDMSLWDMCREELPPLGKREPMVVALDAAVTNDSFAFVGVTRHPLRHDDVAIRMAREWRPVNGRIDFEGSEDNPGPLRFLRNLGKEYNIAQVCFDPTELRYAAQILKSEGVFWLKEFPQGGQRLESDKQFLDLIIHRRLSHDGNADLRRHISNANRKPDPETRKLRIVKREANLKIDMAVAGSMGSYECLRLAL